MKNLLLAALATFLIIMATAHAAFASANCLGQATPLVTGITATSYTDSAVVDSNKYYYMATAVDASGNESGCSLSTNGLIPSSGTHTVSLTWTASTGAATYNIYRVAAPLAPINFTGTVN